MKTQVLHIVHPVVAVDGHTWVFWLL